MHGEGSPMWDRRAMWVLVSLGALVSMSLSCHSQPKVNAMDVDQARKWADEAEALEAELRDTRASQAPAESARERATRHLSEEALQSHNRAGNMGPYSFPSLINEFRRAPNSALVTWCLVIWADRTLPEQVALIKESSSKEKDA